MSRNNTIDFWRIIFTYMIVIFHFDTSFPFVGKMGLTPGWYIAVEFFFIVSGYLLYHKVCGDREETSPWGYTMHRYRQIYPKYLISLLLTFAVSAAIRGLSAAESVDLLLDSYWELLGLQGIGLSRGWDYINPVNWYISVLFISGFILWYFLKRHKKAFIHLIAPVFVMIAYSNLYRISGTKNAAVDIEGFYVNYALMKGIADMCMGVFAAKINERIREKQKNQTGGWRRGTTLQAAAAAGFVFVMILAAVRGNSKLDCLMALVLTLSVALAFLPAPGSFFGCRLIRGWSRITLNIYLLHEVFRTWIFPRLFPGKYALHQTMLIMALYILCVTGAAVLFEYLLKYRKKRNETI